jgi:RHS repeat-associated protein
VTNGAGAIEAAWAYGPYGEVVASNPGFDTPFTFVGEWNAVQLASGLFQMGRRAYDVATAAFLSRDPVHPHLHPLSFNPYQYAGRDPIGRFDPTGADVTDAAAANENSTGQAVLSTAGEAISATGQLSEMTDTVQTLANASEDTTKAASRALGANLILGHALAEQVQNGLGGPGARVVNQVIDTATAISASSRRSTRAPTSSRPRAAR